MRSPVKPCDEWPLSKFRNGYGQDKSIPGEQYAHRVAWIKHYGPIPDGLKVLHHCDNRPCREITHLFLGTSADNSADMRAKRRQMHGEGHVHARLTDDTVRALRTLRPAHTLRELSEMFNISKSVISNVCNGKAWRHVDEVQKG